MLLDWKTGEPREKPHNYGETIQTPHRKDPLTESEPQTFLVWSRAPKYRTTLPPPRLLLEIFQGQLTYMAEAYVIHI